MRSPSSVALGTDLDWLRRVLWPGEGLVRVSSDSVPIRGFRRARTYAVLPSARRPRLLVPLADRRAARASLFQFNDSMTQGARVRKAIAGLGVGFTLGRSLARDRLHVDVSADVGDPDLASLLLEEHLARMLGVDEVVTAIAFGSLRPNRKPILQIMRPDGSVLGYAKLAWNTLTERLVATEAGALRALTTMPPKTFATPTLLVTGTWRGRPLSITSPIRQHVRRRGRHLAMPPPDILREIAEREGLDWLPLARVPLVGDIREGLEAGPPNEEREEVRRLLDRLEAAAGDSRILVGAWHGDCGPWNMDRSPRGITIWDWERARSGVPVGLDIAHVALQLALQRTGRRPGDALEAAGPAGIAGLRELGVEPETWPILRSLYLFELFLRYDEATNEGVIGRDDQVRREIVTVLRRMPWERTA